jgi:ADP-heptose:LPS heptosyltransferase
MTSPVLRRIKLDHPACNLVFACHPSWSAVPWLMPEVDEVWPYPFQATRLRYDAGLVWLGGVIEHDDDSEHTHAVDLIAARAGYAEMPDKRIQLIPAGETPLPGAVGVQISASAACRSLTAAKTMDIVRALRDAGKTVYLFGLPGQVQGEPPECVVDLTREKLSIEQLAAWVTRMECMVTPDSGLFHLAAGYGVPTVGIFGSFDGSLRKTCDCQRVIQLHGDCAPCHHHTGTTQFPQDGPCAKTGRCEVLDAVDVRRVVDVVLEATA